MLGFRMSKPSAREVFAESISNELSRDLDADLIATIDRILIRLWLFGYMVSNVPDIEDEEDV